MAYNYNDNPQGISREGSETNLNYACLKELIPQLLATKNTFEKLKVLEVGAGGGRNLLYLADLFPNQLELFATDISKTAVDFAAKHGVDHSTVSSAEVIPFMETFDLVLLVDILEHLPTVAAAQATITNCLNHLQTKGVLYVTSPIELNRFTLTWWFSKFPFSKKMTMDYFGHTIQFTKESFLTLFGSLDHKKQEIFYSAHIITQLQMLVFFYLPKILLNALGGKQVADSVKDSHLKADRPYRKPAGVLLILRTLLMFFSRPLAVLGFWESIIMRENENFAGNIHLVVKKHEQDIN